MTRDYSDARLEQFAQEIKAHLPDIGDDEMAEALAALARHSPDERAFFGVVRCVTPTVTYGWRRETHQLCLYGIRLKDDVAERYGGTRPSNRP